MKNRIFILIVLSTILLAGCGAGVSVQTTATLPLPTSTLTPTVTYTPEPTFTPSATPTPKLPVSAGTSIPLPNSALSEDNLDQIVELARWGKGVITDAVYSPDGKLIGVATTLGVSLYDAETLEELLYFETDSSVNSLAFSLDGNTLATGLIDNSIRVWKVSDGTLLKKFENQQEETANSGADNVQVNVVAFSPNGELLAAGLSDGNVNVWKLADDTIILTPKKQGSGISGLFFSPDGSTLISSSYDGTTYSRNVVDGKLIGTFGGRNIRVAALSANGKILVTYDRRYINETGNLFIWDTENGKKLQTIVVAEKYQRNDVSSLSISPDGQLLAAGLEDHTIKIWSVGSGVLQNTLEDLRPNNGWYYLDSFTVAFSADSQFVLLAGADTIGVWNVRNGNLLNREIIKSDAGYKLAISPDGQILASVEGPNVYLRQISDGNSISIQDNIQSNESVAFLPDGTTLVISMFDNTVRFWPLSEKGLRKTFEMEEKGYINIIAISPDGKILAVGGFDPTGKVELRQISDGSLISTIGFGSGRADDMAFSQNGDVLAVAGFNQIRLVNASDGKLLKSFSNTGSSLALSPDGSLVAGAYEEASLRIWNTSSGEPLYTIKDLPDSVTRLVFSPDGNMLVIGYSDGTIEFRLVSDGTLLKNWEAHSRSISDIIFTTDGKYLISTSWDGTIRVWGIKP